MKIPRAAHRCLFRSILALPLAVTAIATAAGAPPDPGLRQSPSFPVAIFAMMGLVAVIVVVSLMPSKRGHQD